MSISGDLYIGTSAVPVVGLVSLNVIFTGSGNVVPNGIPGMAILATWEPMTPCKVLTFILMFNCLRTGNNEASR